VAVPQFQIAPRRKEKCDGVYAPIIFAGFISNARPLQPLRRRMLLTD
jgi:hypothetical protein